MDNPSPSATTKTLDEILTKAFNDFYDYITERDIIKAAHEYSEKTVYKEALAAINNYTTQAVIKELEKYLPEIDRLVDFYGESYEGNPPDNRNVAEDIRNYIAELKGGIDE